MRPLFHLPSFKPCLRLGRFCKANALPLSLAGGIVFLIVYWNALMAMRQFLHVKPFVWPHNLLGKSGMLEEDTPLHTLQEATDLYTNLQQFLPLSSSVPGNHSKTKSPLLPPPGFEAFLNFAKENRCRMMGGYRALLESLTPLRSLSQTQYQVRLRSLLNSTGIKSYRIDKGVLTPLSEDTDHGDKAHDAILNAVAPHFPRPVTIVLNTLDTPRILPGPSDIARSSTDQEMHWNTPDPSTYYAWFNAQCPLKDPLDASKQESVTTVNHLHGLSLHPAKYSYTSSIAPIISYAKAPCFADLLMPSPDHYKSSLNPPQDTYNWKGKLFQMVWRGPSSGGIATNITWNRLQRHRFLATVQNDLNFDAAFTTLAQCQERHICRLLEKAFKFVSYPPLTWFAYLLKDVVGIQAKRELPPPQSTFPKAVQYKYIMDLDGNGPNEEFITQLKSNSLIFRATVFEEFFTSWLQPYVHYVPVRLDYQDLKSKIKWAILNDGEAQRVQSQGASFANAFLTPKEMECWTFFLLLELARLENGDEA